MENAKKVWLLSNGEFVSVGDNVQIDNGKQVCIAKVTTIGEDYIIAEINSGGEIDAYFSELKDVRVIK